MNSFGGSDLEFLLKKSLEKIEQLSTKSLNLYTNVEDRLKKFQINSNTNNTKYIEFFQNLNHFLRDIDGRFETDIEAPLERLTRDLSKSIAKDSDLNNNAVLMSNNDELVLENIPVQQESSKIDETDKIAEATVQTLPIISDNVQNKQIIKEEIEIHENENIPIEVNNVEIVKHNNSEHSKKIKSVKSVKSSQERSSEKLSKTTASEMVIDCTEQNDKLRLKLWPLEIGVVKLNYYAYVTHVLSPTLFWCQLSTVSKMLNLLSRNMSKFYNNPENQTPVQIPAKTFCAARFSVDSSWYRAKIIKYNKKDKCATVFYVDFGNTELLPLSELRELASKFYETPILAVPFSLANAYPRDNGGWTLHEIEAFKKCVINKELRLETTKRHPDWPVYFCSLSKNNEDILEILEKNNEIKRVSSDLIKSKFRKYLEKEKYLIKVEQTDLNETPVSPKILLDETIAKVTINNSKTDNLKVDNVTVKVKNTESKPKYQVNRPFLRNEITKNIEMRVLNFSQDSNKQECKIGHVVTPSEFYICLTHENFEKYDVMETHINEFYAKNQQKFIYGSNKDHVDLNICVIFSYTNKKYCRALIKNKELDIPEPFYTVHLMDYGQYEQVNEKNMYYLVGSFSVLPPFVIKCSLDYIQPYSSNNEKCEWNANSIEFFKKKIDEYQTHYISVFNDSELIECPLDFTLKVILKGELGQDMDNIFIINDEMIRYGFAQTIWDTTKTRNNGLILDSDECEVESFKLQRISKYLDDCTSKSLSKWVYDNDENEVEEKSIDDNFVPKVLMNKILDWMDRDEPSTTTTTTPNDNNNNNNKNQNDNNLENQNTNASDDKFSDVDIQNINENLEVNNNNINNVVNEDLQSAEPEIETIKDLEAKQSNEISEAIDDIKINAIEEELIEEVVQNTDELNNRIDNKIYDWNPMKDHFESARNIYDFDEENTENIVLGFAQEEIKNACRNYQKGKCNRENCPFIHTKLLYKPKKIYLDVFDDAEGFEINTNETFTIVIDKLLTSSNFNAFIFGGIDDSGNLKNPEWLDILTKRMNSFYNKHKFMVQKTLRPFYPGELVAVYNNDSNCWYRGKILPSNTDTSYEDTSYLVQYFDYPYEEIVSIKNIYPIKETFLNYKSNMHNFILYGVDDDYCLPETLDYINCLLKLQSGFDLYAVIKDYDKNFKYAILYLIIERDSMPNEIICINDYLITNQCSYLINLIESLSLKSL